jgi:hypothetical protein
LCFFTQNGYAIYYDVNGRKIPGLEQFGGLVDVESLSRSPSPGNTP